MALSLGMTDGAVRNNWLTAEFLTSPPADNIAALTERQRSIVLRRRSGETFTAIAQSLGVTPTAIRTAYLKAEYAARTGTQQASVCPHCGRAL
jgi:DNA-binding NarL/FixJ family response regulator